MGAFDSLSEFLAAELDRPLCVLLAPSETNVPMPALIGVDARTNKVDRPKRKRGATSLSKQVDDFTQSKLKEKRLRLAESREERSKAELTLKESTLRFEVLQWKRETAGASKGASAPNDVASTASGNERAAATINDKQRNETASAAIDKNSAGESKQSNNSSDSCSSTSGSDSDSTSESMAPVRTEANAMPLSSSTSPGTGANAIRLGQRCGRKRVAFSVEVVPIESFKAWKAELWSSEEDWQNAREALQAIKVAPWRLARNPEGSWSL